MHEDLDLTNYGAEPARLRLDVPGEAQPADEVAARIGLREPGGDHGGSVPAVPEGRIDADLARRERRLGPDVAVRIPGERRQDLGGFRLRAAGEGDLGPDLGVGIRRQLGPGVRPAELAEDLVRDICHEMGVINASVIVREDATPDRLIDFIAGNRVYNKGLLVMFICNHCPYVKHVRDGLIQLARDYALKGLATVAQEVFGPTVEALPDINIVPESVYPSGDTVAVVHRYKSESAGLDLVGSGFWEVADGKIVRYRQFVDTVVFRRSLPDA